MIIDFELEPGESPPPLSEVKWWYIKRILAWCHGNKTRAARVLGMDRRTFYRQLKKAETQANG